MFNLKKEYGSVMDFVRDERLRWTEMKPKAAAFQNPGNCMLYFFEKDISNIQAIGQTTSRFSTMTGRMELTLRLYIYVFGPSSNLKMILIRGT